MDQTLPRCGHGLHVSVQVSAAEISAPTGRGLQAPVQGIFALVDDSASYFCSIHDYMNDVSTFYAATYPVDFVACTISYRMEPGNGRC